MNDNITNIGETKFKEYFKNSGINNEYYDILKMTWNAAITEATKLVERKFDECEPWLTPGEMSFLKA